MGVIHPHTLYATGLNIFLLRVEAVECISDPKDTVENKVIALDNLEMVGGLVEGLDHAAK
jgi:hypothetical protein